LQGKTLKIFKAEIEATIPHIDAGMVATDNKTYLKFACLDGFIHIKEMQLEGKKRMLVEDFLRGYRAAPNGGA
jgi:methionyl-tRNA formyltransferase